MGWAGLSDTIVLFLADDGAVARWLRVAGDAVVARGEGVFAGEGEAGGADALRWVAVAPAAAVTLHWAELPAASPAQAVAAAKLLVAEASAAPLSSLHVAVGDEGRAERPIAVVASAEVTRWLAALAGLGIDAHALIPAPMLLPRTDAGYVRADLGDAVVLRGAGAGFADEPGLTALVTAGEPVDTLDRAATEAAVIAAVAAPPLDLRQGPVARRRRRTVDWALVRRLGWLAAAVLLLTLAIDVAKWIHYSVAAASIDAQADTLARGGLPAGEAVDDAGRQLATRLARAQGAGAGFSRTAAATFAAVRAVPGTAVTALNFDTVGALHVSLTAPGQGQLSELAGRVRAYGFAVTLGAFSGGEGGKTSGELTVAAP
jgi:general secretion pathway protein L